MITVVKLGGSMARSTGLKGWLDALTDATARVVLVSGGGPFADQVRALQTFWAFDDGAAHAMAMLAMEQYGRMLAALNPKLRPASSMAAIRQAWKAGEIPVWMPLRMASTASEISESWNVTSDSLAAWLAGRLAAQRLILVKSVPIPSPSVAAAELSRRGIVDQAFPAFLARSTSQCWCIGPDQERDLARALRNGSGPGTQVLAPA